MTSAAIVPLDMTIIPQFVPLFSGSGGKGSNTANAWIRAIERFAKYTPNCGSTGCLQCVEMRLTDVAEEWYTEITKRRKLTWHDFKDAFLDRWGEQEDALLARLSRCRQEAGESAQEYADRFRSLVSRLDMGSTRTLGFQFINGLNDYLRNQVMLQRLKELDEVIDYSIYLDEWEQRKSPRNSQSPYENPYQTQPTPIREPRRPNFANQEPYRPPRTRSFYPPPNPRPRPPFPPASPRPSAAPQATPYSRRDNFQAVTGYTLPYRPPQQSERPNPRPVNNPESSFDQRPRPSAPSRNPPTSVDQLTEELANLKLMYERDTGARPPGAPVCRLCYGIGHIARNCPFQPVAHYHEDEEFDYQDQPQPEEYFDPLSQELAMEAEEAFMAEKRQMDFAVQPKPRKSLVAFDIQKCPTLPPPRLPPGVIQDPRASPSPRPSKPFKPSTLESKTPRPLPPPSKPARAVQAGKTLTHHRLHHRQSLLARSPTDTVLPP